MLLLMFLCFYLKIFLCVYLKKNIAKNKPRRMSFYLSRLGMLWDYPAHAGCSWVRSTSQCEITKRAVESIIFLLEINLPFQ